MNIDYLLELHCVSRKKKNGENPSVPEIPLPDYYELATDADFSGDSNGYFRYVGTKQYVLIPNKIKGVEVTSYSEMFTSNTIIKGVASFNKNITGISYMFYNCSSLTSLDLSNFNTSNVTRMDSMFYNCSSLTSLDLSNFNTSKVTRMDSMFWDCLSLTSLDLSNFNTSNVSTMETMFYNCSKLTLLDLSSFDTSKVTNTLGTFRNCLKVTTAYARTQADADNLNASSNKPNTFRFAVKP